MTGNQTKEMFSLLTKCVNGIQKLDEDVSILKEDVSTLKADVAVLKEDFAVLKEDVGELKQGQLRIEKEVRLNTIAINEIAAEHFRLKIRVDQIEKASV